MTTDLRSAAARRNDLLAKRLDTLVPSLLEESGIDAWVIIGREYAEGPVLRSMLPAEWLSARRTTMLVLTSTERFAVARYPVGDLFPSAWDPQITPNQWDRLAELLGQLDPGSIAIETSPHQAHADGLTSTLHMALKNAMPAALEDRLVSGDEIGIRWLETRLPEERHTLAEATRLAHRILREGLSAKIVNAGETTTDDLVWWYRQTVKDAGLASWFQPSVTLQRCGADTTQVIQPGDLIHVDFGIVHDDMCTDQQEHAYVLRPGESQPPRGLVEGMHAANSAQDILMGEFATDRSGNEILASALAACRDQELAATIYTHSIGLQGHGAGMTIGMWDQQGGVPGAGDHTLHPDTAYSIELMVESRVAEWGGQQVRFMVEQDAWFDGDSVSWLDGRQTALHLIPS
jgi:Xaa-Pro aminopeptidase